MGVGWVTKHCRIVYDAGIYMVLDEVGLSYSVDNPGEDGIQMVFPRLILVKSQLNDQQAGMFDVEELEYFAYIGDSRRHAMFLAKKRLIEMAKKYHGIELARPVTAKELKLLAVI